MDSNWKQRYNQAEDTRVGRERDKDIELGIRLACVAIHNEYGFGAKRIQHIREVIQNEYIEKEFNGGAERHSTARRLNVLHGIAKLHEAYEAIFKEKGSKK